MKVLGISGSLRRASFNTALLRAARELAPPGMNIEEHSIAEIPLYNDDVRVAGYPAPAEALRSAIESADALLIVTPEYNYSIPGVLKNAIDWASRPPSPPLAGKPLGMMSASTGLFGGVRAQYHLRQIAVFVDLLPLNKPEIFVTKAAEKFDADSRLVDEATRKAVSAFLASFATWVDRLSSRK
jgi:chromate reductase